MFSCHPRLILTFFKNQSECVKDGVQIEVDPKLHTEVDPKLHTLGGKFT